MLFRSALLRACPNLHHLHLDTPFFLKLLDVPSTLDTITIEAPPREHIVGWESFSTIMGYNVSAALHRGLLPARFVGHRRTLIVRTGLAEPHGYKPVREACGQYGVVLVKEVVYMH